MILDIDLIMNSDGVIMCVPADTLLEQERL